ncbi:MAG: type II toxin-antitoxin system VapC family toxin [Brachymonas denitrificans]|jgi:predicted nucleic acid-binding protein|uniref:type II toxin-antitoxin system VapC family toxin n=1 Tax=Brachymonas denitrificans TaxID=28220 RepID=UPI001BCCAB25|nr:type II toxin-antitoxin system VapC family toxin [Brachymonas denitrificans]
MYLLDTNVVSELRKAMHGRADPRVVAWQAQVDPSHCFIATTTVMELEIGILRMERRDAMQGAILRQWLEQHVLPAFSQRILSFDLATARQCARLHVPDPRSERDAMIAATALVHGLTVVTRNAADFEATGVPLLNPWGKWTLQEQSADYLHQTCASTTPVFAR